MTIEHVLGLCRQLAAARAARQVNREHCTVNMLIDAISTLPDWMLPPVVEPAAEVERALECGARYRLANEDGSLALVLRDHDGEVLAPVMTSDEGSRMRADLARVLAAIGGAR